MSVHVTGDNEEVTCGVLRFRHEQADSCRVASCLVYTCYTTQSRRNEVGFRFGGHN